MSKRNNEISHIIELSDGRSLGYAEYGDPQGKPLFYFHGRDGSRIEAAFGKEESAADLGIRFICLDRPGMGLSEYKKSRRLLDWPDDVLELAAQLGFERFAVLGGSGGAPYALACAYKIPKHLTACAIVSGLGPYELSKKWVDRRNKNLLLIARHFPRLYRLLLWLIMGRKINDKIWWEKNYERLNKMLPEPDQKIVRDLRVKERMISKTVEAFRQGSKGPAHDFKLYAKPWGFNLKEISEELKVFIFHGEADRTVPIPIAKSMYEQIPNCGTKIYPNEGHLSVFINNFSEIVKSITP
ncbi:MAG: alpha/beta fold hydrolase [Candidatus Hodarchaeota archaeon]